MLLRARAVMRYAARGVIAAQQRAMTLCSSAAKTPAAHHVFRGLRQREEACEAAQR